MFKRTGYQFGCLERKKRRNGPDVWVFRYREMQADGSRVHRSVVVGAVERYPTKALARKAAESLRMSANPDNPAQAVVSFGALLDRYIAEELPQRECTRRHYMPWLNKHIRPKWGSYALNQIKAFAVEQWLKTLDLAPKSKAHIKSLMHMLFNCAMRWELIQMQANPMSLVRVKDGSKRSREPRVLTPAEFQTLQEHMEEPYRTMCVVAMCLGLRVSEIVGLQWGDFDWDKLQVMVQRSVVLGNVGEVKTKYSRKQIPLDHALAHMLFSFKERTAPDAQDSDWVFVNLETGKPWWPGRIQQKKLAPAGVKAGLGKIGWHSFRHTYSTLLRSLKVDVKVQQELLRHADIRTTMNVYTQAIPADLREANSKVVCMVLPARTA